MAWNPVLKLGSRQLVLAFTQNIFLLTDKKSCPARGIVSESTRKNVHNRDCPFIFSLISLIFVVGKWSDDPSGILDISGKTGSVVGSGNVRVKYTTPDDGVFFTDVLAKGWFVDSHQLLFLIKIMIVGKIPQMYVFFSSKKFGFRFKLDFNFKVNLKSC